MVSELQNGWEVWGLHLIPGALKSIHDSANQKKLELYPKVYPLYSAIIQNAPAQLPLIQAKEVSRAETGLIHSSVADGASAD
jgi:hypothetical protein